MLSISSSALQPLCKYHPIEQTNDPQLSAPFDVVKVKLEYKNLIVCVKANDRQKSSYTFFNLAAKEEAVELYIRRRISKENGVKLREQDFLLDFSKCCIFNRPLTLRLFRRTVKGSKLIHEEVLKP